MTFEINAETYSKEDAIQYLVDLILEHFESYDAEKVRLSANSPDVQRQMLFDIALELRADLLRTCLWQGISALGLSPSKKRGVREDETNWRAVFESSTQEEDQLQHKIVHLKKIAAALDLDLPLFEEINVDVWPGQKRTFDP